MTARRTIAADGTAFRDLDHDGVMAPFEDPRLPAQRRVADLLPRLSLAEKAGLLFHTVIEVGANGTLLTQPGPIAKSATADVVRGKLVNHFNVHQLPHPRLAARWYNAVQDLAADTPHGIPVTISTDPRHGSVENMGASFAALHFSRWPEPLGLAALGDVDGAREFADIARQEYCAVGIRAALHPMLDLATEPRWARISGTFGQDPELAARLGVAWIEGFQRGELTPGSVACTAKHFPGGGPQRDGEDAHFPYGREQVYPSGAGEAHLLPFRAAVAAGVAGMMPYYGLPIGLELEGIRMPEVGFGYSRPTVTELLRDRLGFEGVVLSDWELVNDNHVGDQVLPARAWGVEHLSPSERMELILDAGCDQFGGEECVDLLVGLVSGGRVSEARLDESARRLLVAKFRLGLFDDPYVDEDAAESIVGRADFVAAGHVAQGRSVTVLSNDTAGGSPLLPLAQGVRVYVEGMDPAVVSRYAVVVRDLADAQVALVRTTAPFDPRDDLFLEKYFHQGSLDFAPGFVARMARVARECPLVLDVALDRPAVLTPLVPLASVLTATYGTGDAAYLDAITGRVPPVGRLPFDLPRSMAQVREHPSDRPGFADPLFAYGHGLPLG